jgi:hypothetical protein
MRELLAEALERDLEILDDRVALLLRGEGLLAGALDRVLEQVVETSDARGLLLVDQGLAAGRHEQRLHVALGLREVEELAAIGLAAHLDDLPRLVEADVREAAGRDVEMGIATLLGGGGDLVRQIDDQIERLDVDRRQLRLRRGGFLGALRGRGHAGRNLRVMDA